MVLLGIAQVAWLFLGFLFLSPGAARDTLARFLPKGIFLLFSSLEKRREETRSSLKFKTKQGYLWHLWLQGISDKKKGLVFTKGTNQEWLYKKTTALLPEGSQKGQARIAKAGRALQTLKTYNP